MRTRAQLTNAAPDPNINRFVTRRLSEMSSTELRFIARVTCPHCWQTFPPEDILWVAQNAKLMGDPKLGAREFRRFLPTRFDAAGQALDAFGTACKDLACPSCHLTIPRAMLTMPPTFFSILGTPSSGKTYFMASMTHRLRYVLKSSFSLNFGDADTSLNNVVIENENRLFGSPDSDKLVTLEKTQEGQEGHFDEVIQHGQTVTYPRPFVFTLSPDERHPFHSQGRKLSRSLCFYDNAGEDFQSGHDAATNPVVRHLLKSRAVFYIFDPTQEASFRRECTPMSNDPQLRSETRSYRQEQVLMVAGECVRQLGNEEMRKRPLIVCVAKYDAWAGLVGGHRLSFEELLRRSGREGVHFLDCEWIERESAMIRKLLLQLAPLVVAAAENFSSQVIYMPCSALGRSPEAMPHGGFGIRPKDIRPMRIEAPIAYSICRFMRGLILPPQVNVENRAAGAVRMPSGPGAAGASGSSVDGQGTRVDGTSLEEGIEFPRVWEDTGS